MTKKKMCRYYEKHKDDTYCCSPGDKICPTNTNSKCELIPSKPNVVRVKAWAVGSAKNIEAMYDTSACGWRYAVFKTRSAARLNANHSLVSPCTITIAAKYLKPAKGKGEK